MTSQPPAAPVSPAPPPTQSRPAGRCPGCGVPVPPGRLFCRPSCRLRYERRTRPPTLPGLFPLTLDSEFEEE